MDYRLHTLHSGLRVITVPMPNLESATLTVWVKTGSRNEERGVAGISHFLEHMVFKGSKKRPSAKAISEAVDAMGGEFNAATSKDWTCFYIKARVGALPICFDVLSDMVLNPLLKPADIAREKGVIIEELAMYEDTPLLRIGDVFEELIFAPNPLSWDTGGTAQSVRRIERADFVSYRKRHYYPENILVSVAGGVEEKKVLELVKSYFGKLSSEPRLESKTKSFTARQTVPQVKLHPKKKEQAHFILGFLADGRGYEGKYNQAVLAVILGGGMSSRLFIEIRERRGLAYAVRTSTERYNDTGYLGTYAGVDPQKAQEAVKVIIDQCSGLASGKYPISKKEIGKAKEFLKGQLALSLEDTKNVSAFFADQALFLAEIATPEEKFKKIDAVGMDEVLDEARRLFVPSRLNLAIIGPYDRGSEFEKLVK